MSQNATITIDGPMVQRICDATDLPLAVDKEDAIFQLTHLRDYYFHHQGQLPRINKTDLKGHTNAIKSNAKTIISILNSDDAAAFRDALTAAAIDKGHTQDFAHTLIADTVSALQYLRNLADHLEKRKSQYARSSLNKKAAWPLQSQGMRALFPFVNGTKGNEVPVKREQRDKYFYFTYLPDLYCWLFKHDFTVTRDSSGQFSGPGIRFVFAVLDELKLQSKRKPETISALGEFYRRQRRQKNAAAAKRRSKTDRN